MKSAQSATASRQRKSPKTRRSSPLSKVRAAMQPKPDALHHSFRLTPRRRIRFSVVDIVASWRLCAETVRFIRKNARVLLSLAALYAITSYFLVGGISQTNYVVFKNISHVVVNGNFGGLPYALSLFGATFTGSFNETPSDLQTFLAGFLMIVFWLCIVWAARMLSADKKITIRDALYNSQASLISIVAVLAAMCFQMLPAAAGAFAYATAVNGGWLRNGGVEAYVFAGVAVLLIVLSGYWLMSSFIALSIVTLPGIYPMVALREAKALVTGRRWSLLLRVLFMAILIVLVWMLILVPAFMLDNWLNFNWLPLIPVLVQTLLGVTLLFSSVYIYKLYRSLL